MNKQNSDSDESLVIILETAQSFHQMVLENFRALDNKGSILLTLMGLILIPEVGSLEIPLKIDSILLLISLFSDIVGIYLILFSLKFHKLYIPPNLYYIQELYNQGIETDELRIKLITTFRDASKINANRTKQKARKLVLVYWLLIISFSTYLLYYLIEELL
jgi:hypothetical protein